ncbi:hypothetical protein BGZ83_004456 [Gryganskiella cystojenkinii]|nr:hypothetical protein BGZ83_004456 [Gryganskiella cystojenkinii]
MAPPKKTTTPAEINVASNFFQRGKKPTLAQRTVTGKPPMSSPQTTLIKAKVAPVHDEVSDEIEEDQDSDEDDEQEEHELESQDEQDDDQEAEEDDGSIVQDDEIQSDDGDSDFQKKDKGPAVAAQPKKNNQSTVAGPISKPNLRTRSTTNNNNRKKAIPYVAPNVGDIHTGFHQADLSPAEKMLRQFDLTSKFGPCTDMTRLERWERAFELGLNPPQDVKDTLMQHLSLNTPLFQGRV